MARQSARVSEILRLVEFYRYAIDRMSAEHAAEFRIQARRIEQQIYDLIAQGGTDKITQRKVDEVSKTLREIFSNGKREVMQLTTRQSLDIAGVSLRRSQDLWTAFGSTPSARALSGQRAMETFLRFEHDVRSQRLLRVVEPYAERWSRSWTADEGNWAKVATKVQANFVRGQRERWSVHRLAEHMRGVGELKVVPGGVVGSDGVFRVRGHMSPDAFARGYARAKNTDLTSQISLRLGEEAGLDLILNIGVMDDRQSEECAIASAREAMTMEAWEATPEGLPPRHVLNCRCTPLHVPRVVAAEWVPQINEHVLEAA